MDLGMIRITSSLDKVAGKWRSLPDKKCYVNNMNIEMKSFKIDYNGGEYQITPPFDMKIEIERINFTELLQDQFLAEGFDFEEFNKADMLQITTSPFEMNFKRDIYTYFLRCSDLNFNYFDNLAPGYQLFSWNSSDFMHYLDLEQKTVATFTQSPVFKRDIQMHFDSFCMRINEDTAIEKN